VRRWLIDWGKRQLQRTLERELAQYRLPAEVRVRPFNSRAERMPQKQVFRSLIQVNFYPRERDE
jgi:hypothetical protein